jgi:aminoglycoside 6-adenylyltransferase|nr:aminoglycoside 6-adenylyltransferase [uncultured Lachnoclostridium sp.]
MRSKKEMFELILHIAEEDERIRAVLLSGSRANSDIPKDIFQDYDITYFVTDAKPFYNNCDWIEEKFGKPAIMQLPELMSHPLLPPDGDGHFAYLMIFKDGNRIDLSIEFTPYIDDGEPVVVLLDKDKFLPDIVPNKMYWCIKPPSENIFADTCNEFWWCLNNVAKGIARDELPYAKNMFDHYVRDMLNQMTEWFIGVDIDFTVSSGKMGKYFKRYLPQKLYEMYANTYSDSNYENFWSSIFSACELFRTMADIVAEHFGFRYNRNDDENMMMYLNKVKNNSIVIE